MFNKLQISVGFVHFVCRDWENHEINANINENASFPQTIKIGICKNKLIHIIMNSIFDQFAKEKKRNKALHKRKLDKINTCNPSEP